MCRDAAATAKKSVTIVPAGLNLDTVHNMDLVRCAERSLCFAAIFSWKNRSSFAKTGSGQTNVRSIEISNLYPVSLKLSACRVPANARSSSSDPAQQVERAANGVHPADAGQAQIADALWSWLKFRMSLL